MKYRTVKLNLPSRVYNQQSGEILRVCPIGTSYQIVSYSKQFNEGVTLWSYGRHPNVIQWGRIGSMFNGIVL